MYEDNSGVQNPLDVQNLNGHLETGGFCLTDETKYI